MRKLVYYIGTSLDGYIAGPQNQFDFFPLSDEMAAWINARYPETVPTHIREHVGLLDADNLAFDTVLMGRGTYEPARSVGISSPYAHLRQFVVSTSLGPIEDDAVTLVTDPEDTVRALKAEDGLDIWLAGGGVLAGALLPHIDELIVKRYPVVAGSGVPMISGSFAPTLFEPTRTESFPGGTTVTWLARR
ncbi:deaminase [Rhodococcoides trifolii]|uniref:Deaminase n=1 Tax=Rhodococcoides trifolii TaxID=908250 RepID=A0A917FW30_9NOCA|nr:dihydrofolate reductase family protein [Rhodococcus trifolii]GGG06110.1 deaminase [Rhodococcus trifolii]